MSFAQFEIRFKKNQRKNFMDAWKVCVDGPTTFNFIFAN